MTSSSAFESRDPLKDSPFKLENVSGYRRWRDAKLLDYPASVKGLVVKVANSMQLTEEEVKTMTSVLRKTNMVIYDCQVRPEDKNIPRTLGQRFGLRRLDSNLLADDDDISSLEVMPEKSERGYIPYSNKRMLWHTDGYYNEPNARIRAFILHCARPAAAGGENSLLDHEVAYILLRDANPDYVRALMAVDAMTIPANTEEKTIARAAVSGPVFSVDATDGSLHMRYTARTRSIEWKADALTREAVQFLERILAEQSVYTFRHTMDVGQGLLCNNVLHNRTALTDDVSSGKTRLIYRARYYDRVAGTPSAFVTS